MSRNLSKRQVITDDVLACTPMSKLELTKFILTNQNELSKKQQIDNKQLNSKNRSINR